MFNANLIAIADGISSAIIEIYRSTQWYRDLVLFNDYILWIEEFLHLLVTIGIAMKQCK